MPSANCTKIDSAYTIGYRLLKLFAYQPIEVVAYRWIYHDKTSEVQIQRLPPIVLSWHPTARNAATAPQLPAAEATGKER